MAPVAADVLNAAADHLAENGWHEGIFGPAGGDLDGFVLALGPLAAVTADIDSYSAAREAISAQVGGDPAEWNDTPGRTADDVISALRAAAASVGG